MLFCGMSKMLELQQTVFKGQELVLVGQRFRGPVPDGARVPVAPIPWVTLWEAEPVGRREFTELQHQSLLQALRLLEAEEEGTTQIGGL